MISSDIEELSKEKHMLEAEILQKEAEIKIKSSEAKSLQVMLFLFHPTIYFRMLHLVDIVLNFFIILPG